VIIKKNILMNHTLFPDSRHAKHSPFGWGSFRIAIRNLRRNGLYSWINIAGLAVCLAAVLLILLWVNDEMSFDKFHKRSRDIYLSVASFNMGDKQEYWKSSSPPIAGMAKNEIPEVENACRILEYWDTETIKHGDNTLSDVRCALVDPSFFSIFSFHLREGNIHAVLPDRNSVVLSESAAGVLFGNEEAVGKTVVDHLRREFHVTGVLADMPENSSNRYNVIFSFAFYEALTPQLNEWWGNLNYKTYFLLQPGADANNAAQKITGIHSRHSQWALTYLLHPLEKENLYNLDGTANTKLQACRLFAVAVALLLLIACINYVNLVTARSSRRNKEIFVRNVLGARKINLFAHFFNESLLLFFCSLIVATLLIYLLFPLYNQITGKQLEFHLFSLSTLAIFGLTFLVTSLFAGIYPALALSLRPKTVNEAVHGRTGVHALVRKSMVVMQFVASVILIIGAFTINRQMQFIKLKNPGYDKEHVFYVGLTRNMRTNMEDVKTRVLQSASVAGATIVSQPLNNIRQFNAGGDWEGKGDRQVTFTILATDRDFIPTMGIKLAEGINFSGTPADNNSFIINREAAAQMGLHDPVGKQVRNMEGDNATIIGVTEDFHFKNMHEKIGPLLIKVNPQASYLYVKTVPGNAIEALKVVENVYRGYDPDLPFDYSFMDEDFDRVYKNDIRTGRLFNVFAFIAILVSCLGLFGLVTFTAETKTKEIGIRKALGASVAAIVKMLSKEFLILVGIAMLIAFPLAFYWLEDMLQDYAYRIDIDWRMFALAGIITMTLTLLTVGWKAVKAATANPVKALKSE
jgi:ABC-type antimicrobial peptide transport system permease subunit